jgi:L-serine dehydratase
VLGLSGYEPHTIPPEIVEPTYDRILSEGVLTLAGQRDLHFREATDLIFDDGPPLPRHPNGMIFVALDAASTVLIQDTFYSVGGGFFVSEAEALQGLSGAAPGPATVPYEFRSGVELLQMCRTHNLSIADLILANEAAYRPAEETTQKLDDIWATMEGCIARGCQASGILPGGLNVPRRAQQIHQKLLSHAHGSDPLFLMDWVSLFALAVNEENAAGGKVVTAPTNGAAGVIPAVLAYYRRLMPGATLEGGRTFLLAAAAIGMLYKWNASLSAAEMGCQGEVGVACSMAAAGLAAVLGGTPEQIENAAEIGMEHNLGLTCDPIGGLVQVPCIERNTMGAVKAINAARLAVLYGDGQHRVRLDQVIETMRQTGVDMQVKYKETSLGGLAVNVVEC